MKVTVGDGAIINYETASDVRNTHLKIIYAQFFFQGFLVPNVKSVEKIEPVNLEWILIIEKEVPWIPFACAI